MIFPPSKTYPPWPPSAPWPQAGQESLRGGNPDFPDSPGDREKGKFRPSATPWLTTIAVVGDDGQPVGSAQSANQTSVMEELLMYTKAIAFGIAQLNSMDLDELLDLSNES